MSDAYTVVREDALPIRGAQPEIAPRPSEFPERSPEEFPVVPDEPMPAEIPEFPTPPEELPSAPEPEIT